MKAIDWPSVTKVTLDEDLGAKLDAICVREHLTRPSAVKRAIELLYAQGVKVSEPLPRG